MAVAVDKGRGYAYANLATAPPVALVAAGLALGPSEVAWVGLGSLAAVLLASERRQGPPRDADPLRPLRVELARCRRNQTAADLLTARLPRDVNGQAPPLARALRVTDGVVLRKSSRSSELLALFDARDAARVPVERRLKEIEGDALVCGWARFPDDGVTLEALLDRVGERARSAREHPTRSAETATRGRRVGPAMFGLGHRLFGAIRERS